MIPSITPLLKTCHKPQEGFWGSHRGLWRSRLTKPLGKRPGSCFWEPLSKVRDDRSRAPLLGRSHQLISREPGVYEVFYVCASRSYMFCLGSEQVCTHPAMSFRVGLVVSWHFDPYWLTCFSFIPVDERGVIYYLTLSSSFFSETRLLCSVS